MSGDREPTLFGKIKALFIGRARSLQEPNLFHNISLIAFFAWVGLGADGLTSSCYGPEEAFLALKSHIFLGIFVALATAVTIFIISYSYSQIIELFPSGGGGYLVASKLLSPSLGMVSGCALIIDYVLTITLSISAGADALFSFLPAGFYSYKLMFAVCGLGALIVLNMRGVKESVLPLVPIFLIFMITHFIIIVYGVGMHLSDINTVARTTVVDVKSTVSEMGVFGMLLLIMRAYSMGAGTYTGIEAVSNGIPILRAPRVETAKRTMKYIFYRVGHVPGKTLNAVLVENITSGWGHWGYIFLLVTLVSEAILLFVAAQTGFLDGPRVLANMATDRWFPFQFALLSERFVTQNGILLMGGASLILMILSHGSVKFLVVLYSINVFITFCLSQAGMVRYWWRKRRKIKTWFKKIAINGIGLVMTTFILVSVIVLKFNDGGWITIFITGSLVTIAVLFRRYYKRRLVLLKRLDNLINAADISKLTPGGIMKQDMPLEYDAESKTAVILVSGFNGMGLHTLFNVIRLFGKDFKNYFFIQAGIVDAGHFKGAEDIDKLKSHVERELERYVLFMQNQGFYSKSFATFGIDISEEISSTAAEIFDKYPNAIFFGGQIVFAQETIFTKMMYNYTTFSVQRRLHQKGIPFIIMPVRVD
ncbi:MAG: APC family permease [Candidatus Omnitrophica bacterium]|nr:APC family permease [Candidatus Omnitrophota bacterium]